MCLLSKNSELAGERAFTYYVDQAGWLDVTIDGADEISPRFNLIKGGGGPSEGKIVQWLPIK